MRGFLYAVRMVPSCRIKVGRTSNLGTRLTTHTANASFGGAAIDRAFAVVCEESQVGEDALIATVAALPGARLVHGRETFEGVSFQLVAAVLDDVVNRVHQGWWATPDTPAVGPAYPVPELLQALLDEVTDLPDHARPASRVLRAKLAPEMTETAFGLQLGRWGCRPERDRSDQPKGPRVGDIRKAAQRIRGGGPVKVLKSA